jgi:hypothetical protein
MPLDVPSSRDAAALADWAELLVLATEGASVSATRLGRLLTGEGTDQAEEELAEHEGLDIDGNGEDDLELPLIDEGRAEREVHVEQLLDEISVRLRLGPRVYPFDRTSDRVEERDAAGRDTYLLLLALSWADAPCRGERRLHEAEAAYDRIALEALRRYLGRDAVGVRFARNTHDPDDDTTRPKKFDEAIKWLREKLTLGPGERPPPDEELVAHWEGDAQAEHQGRQPLNSYSDGGVDVVVWWRFADERAGSPVMLAQCTVQIEWGDKVEDVKLKLWKKWIDFATVPPQTALVIPFAVNRTSRTWNDRTTQAGVIIDRLRLLELLNELEEHELAGLVDEPTKAWIAHELQAAA